MRRFSPTGRDRSAGPKFADYARVNMLPSPAATHMRVVFGGLHGPPHARLRLLVAPSSLVAVTARREADGNDRGRRWRCRRRRRWRGCRRWRRWWRRRHRHRHVRPRHDRAHRRHGDAERSRDAEQSHAAERLDAAERFAAAAALLDDVQRHRLLLRRRHAVVHHAVAERRLCHRRRPRALRAPGQGRLVQRRRVQVRQQRRVRRRPRARQRQLRLHQPLLQRLLRRRHDVRATASDTQCGASAWSCLRLRRHPESDLLVGQLRLSGLAVRREPGVRRRRLPVQCRILQQRHGLRPHRHRQLRSPAAAPAPACSNTADSCIGGMCQCGSARQSVRRRPALRLGRLRLRLDVVPERLLRRHRRLCSGTSPTECGKGGGAARRATWATAAPTASAPAAPRRGPAAAAPATVRTRQGPAVGCATAARRASPAASRPIAASARACSCPRRRRVRPRPALRSAAACATRRRARTAAATSSGNCHNTIDTTNCGTHGGGQCSTCDATKANQCTNGGCVCGSTAAPARRTDLHRQRRRGDVRVQRVERLRRLLQLRVGVRADEDQLPRLRLAHDRHLHGARRRQGRQRRRRQCQCGSSAPCGAGLECVGGQCVCDATSCRTGCSTAPATPTALLQTAAAPTRRSAATAARPATPAAPAAPAAAPRSASAPAATRRSARRAAARADLHAETNTTCGAAGSACITCRRRRPTAATRTPRRACGSTGGAVRPARAARAPAQRHLRRETTELRQRLLLGNVCLVGVNCSTCKGLPSTCSVSSRIAAPTTASAASAHRRQRLLVVGETARRPLRPAAARRRASRMPAASDRCMVTNECKAPTATCGARRRLLLRQLRPRPGLLHGSCKQAAPPAASTPTAATTTARRRRMCTTRGTGCTSSAKRAPATATAAPASAQSPAASEVRVHGLLPRQRRPLPVGQRLLQPWCDAPRPLPRRRLLLQQTNPCGGGRSVPCDTLCVPDSQGLGCGTAHPAAAASRAEPCSTDIDC